MTGRTVRPAIQASDMREILGVHLVSRVLDDSPLLGSVKDQHLCNRTAEQQPPAGRP